ncbi:MAG: 2-dehydropantoate 2-reductase [Halomonadaceae bacterium]|nr:MAG: 2-dehydropantoate 2-reductase [Halomonadaceae bacterium]
MACPTQAIPGEKQPMDSLVVGPGALGLLFAARLRALGNVTLVGRKSGLQQSQVQWQDGTLSTLVLPQQGPGEALPEPLDLVLVTTKAGDTLQALSLLLPALPQSVPVLLMQNGMGSQQTVARAFPGHCLLAATTTEGANRPAPDRVLHAGHGETCLGPLTPSAASLAPWVAQKLRQAGFYSRTSHPIEQDLWGKLAVNAGINAFTALLDCPNGVLPEQPDFQQRITPLCREIAAVAQAEGVSLQAEALHQQILTVCARTAGNISSMLQDHRAGRSTEIDYINGYIAQCARAHGLAAPVNQALFEGVKQLHS